MNQPTHLIDLAQIGWSHRNWYQQCQPVLQWAADKLNTTAERIADVLAITSPRCAVTRNVRLTIGYLQTGELLPGVIPSVQTALDHYEETSEIRGPKTSAFAAALRGDDQAVVLDVWMAKALDVDQRKLATKRVRESATRRIRVGAKYAGLLPAQFQAAVWSGMLIESGRRSVPRIDVILKGELDGKLPFSTENRVGDNHVRHTEGSMEDR